MVLMRWKLSVNQKNSDVQANNPHVIVLNNLVNKNICAGIKILYTSVLKRVLNQKVLEKSKSKFYIMYAPDSPNFLLHSFMNQF